MECVKCLCLAGGRVGGLGLGFSNQVGTRGVLKGCLCLGCGGVWSGWGLGSGSGRFGVVMYV